MPIKTSIFMLLFLGALQNGGVHSQSLAAVDSFFAHNNQTIRTEIDGKEVAIISPQYNRIVSQKTGRKLTGISAENQRVNVAYDFYGVSFEGKISLNNIRFEESADLTLAEFTKPFVIQTTSFSKPALFNWANFKSAAVFSRTGFKDDAQFTRANFDSSANFRFSTFENTAFFFGTQFNGITTFNDTKFRNEAIFSFAEFREQATYNRAEFNQIARFNNAEFQKGASFQQASFDSLVDFSNATTHGDLDFTGVKLPRMIDFSDMPEINGIVNLMRVFTTRLSGNCLINLYNTDISKFKLNYDAFTLYFPADVTFKEKVKVYEDLLENFKANELEESYEKLDIEFSQFKYREKRDLATNFIQKVWWNYGYDKNRIFVWIFRILLFFSLINTFFIKRLINAISELPFLTKKTVEKHSLHHPIIAYCLNFPGTLLYTLIMILSGATGLSIIKDHTKIPSVVWMIYMIILSIIGFSLSLFIFNYIIN